MKKRRLISILTVLSLICVLLPVFEVSAASEGVSGGIFDISFGNGMVLDCQRTVKAKTDEGGGQISGYEISARDFALPYSAVTNEPTDLGTDYLKLEYAGAKSEMDEATRTALDALISNAEDTAPVFRLVRYTKDGEKIGDFSNVGYISYCGEGLCLLSTVRGGTAANSYGYFLQAKIQYGPELQEQYSGTTDKTLTESFEDMKEFPTLKLISITTESGERIPLYVNMGDTIGSVKEQLRDKGVTSSEIALYCDGQELADDAVVDQFIDSADGITAVFYDRAISTPDELKQFCDAVNSGDTFEGKTVILKADIALSGSADDQWTPIGDDAIFYGIFDGQGHTISGLYIDNDAKDYVGLFGHVKGAEIKNLNISGSTLTGNNYVGGISAHSQINTNGGVARYSKITNCVIEESVTITGNRQAGGIAGQFDGTIELCVNNAAITVTDKGADSNNNKDLAGGIVGYANNGNGAILNCVNNGDVRGIYTVGGIAGDAQCRMEGCTNNGNVTAACDVENSDYSFVGGIVGNLTGAVYGAAYTGELVDCINTGNVTATGLIVGGVAGYVDGAPLSNVINQGNVQGKTYVGGIAGLVYDADVTGGYSIGTVSADSAAGGIVGHSSSADRQFSDLYFNNEAFQGEAISNNAGIFMKIAGKPLSAFTSGEVAHLLQGEQETQAWGQSLSGDDTYPVLTEDSAKKVYQVVFQTQPDAAGGDYATVYANPSGVGADRMPDDPISDKKAFVKWSKTNGADGEEFTASTAVTQDLTIFAIWTDKPGKPSVTIGGDGTGGKAEPAEDGSVTITPDDGCKIVKITVNGEEVEIPEDGKLTGLSSSDSVVVTFGKNTMPVSQRFTDVTAGAWYEDAVQFVVDHGLFCGTSDTTFSPNSDMTRGMLTTVLYRLEKEPATDAVDLFDDVAGSKYYTEAVAWAAQNQIVVGYGNGKFGPEDAITREQLVVMLWRYAGSPESAGSLDSFTDGAKTSDWAAAALSWAVEQKIVNGKGNGILDPAGKATRAEVAAMLMRYCKLETQG